MAQLSINGYVHPALPYTFLRLFSGVSIMNSSRSNVYNAVRKALRRIFGNNNVVVSCNATYANGQWTGTCKINGTQYTWIVS